ncbi:hypothetical protein RHSIM_Rhsim02G0105000 [Rhododendron simsii]|uniref:Protein kinase domain-containing protein n=1 Tax=Rhododendron simsii TaxID=118357 RepID=A0A834HF33_RHOSS|nr:hypothetical protein RHSIM_Rhsim02G0105000 [Rhododendron simsii]
MEKSRNSALISRFPVAFVALIAATILFPCVEGTTDPSDVQGLQVMYGSLNSPSQLTNWQASGGDPCGQSWKGVTCQGSAVVSIQISGLGLSGTMGYLLSDLTSLRTLDMSNNNIHDSIPYQLPPNLTTLNLANNNLGGNLPYSITTMVSLNYLNVSRNAISQAIGDLFANLGRLATLDLSFNNFDGNLPGSFSSLLNLSTLHVQNNQLSGSLDVLAGLPLTDLNVANNQFTGWIPNVLSSIPNFIYSGNSFDNGPAPPPPPHAPPPPGKSQNNGSHSPPGANTPPSTPDDGNQNNGLTVGPIIGISLGSLGVVLFAMLVFVFCLRKGKKKEPAAAKTSAGSLPVSTEKVIKWFGFTSASQGLVQAHLKFKVGSAVPPKVQTEPKQARKDEAERYSVNILTFLSYILPYFVVNTEMRELRMKSTATVADLRPSEKLIADRMQGKNGSLKRVKSPITATSYTVASLQTATNSFSQENLIGEGSLGRVYRGEFPNGKIAAIKKIDYAAISLQEEDNFLEAVSNMSRLRHPNIIALVGFCGEHGQRLLVHDYVGNGNLHDMLHFVDERSKQLTWNARVRVALGTARALEYLHEVCLPSVVHRNFKSANILLDEELNPHLSDCGLAALTPNTERQVSSTEMISFGYSAPEFALSGIYTVKSDVYSFGVVMLELLTGRKPLDSSRVRAEQSLVRWATPQLHDIDALAKMVDPALNGMYPAKSLSRFADILALCVQPEPEFRPPMSEVVQALVRLMQRASMVKRHSSEESGFMFKTPDHETADISY